MMRRAVRACISADYIAADAWFGYKKLMRAAMALEMTAILRMKRNKIDVGYRVEMEGRTQLLDAIELYQQAVRKQWKKVRGMP